jgi:hypothetical protein
MATNHEHTLEVDEVRARRDGDYWLRLRDAARRHQPAAYTDPDAGEHPAGYERADDPKPDSPEHGCPLADASRVADRIEPGS